MSLSSNRETEFMDPSEEVPVRADFHVTKMRDTRLKAKTSTCGGEQPVRESSRAECHIVDSAALVASPLSKCLPLLATTADASLWLFVGLTK